MRRILLVAFLICMITSVCFAHKLGYEPETDTSASFSATDQYGYNYITFVNYAKNDGTRDYWVRLRIFKGETKILYNAALIIDGVKYELNPVYNVTSKYAYAAYTNIDFNFYHGVSIVQPFRYYDIPQNIVDKILTAKKIVFVYNRADKLRIQVPLYNDYVKDIQSVFALKYSDLNTYFKPAVADD